MADNKTNMALSLAYELSIEMGEEEVIVEECTKERPFQFVTGLGFTFDAFEKELESLKAGDKFNFVIPKEEANGDHDDELVINVDKTIFEVDGKFQDEEIYIGNIIPLVNAEGVRFQGTVLDIKKDKVVIDCNHPLAGKDLHFEGEVLEKRPATPDEVQGMLNVITGHGHCSGCHGNCNGCDKDCGNDCGCEDKSESKEHCKGKGHCKK